MKYYADLSYFAKCWDLRIKKCSATAQNRGGGASANSGNAHFKTVKKKASLTSTFLSSRYGIGSNPSPFTRCLQEALGTARMECPDRTLLKRGAVVHAVIHVLHRNASVAGDVVAEVVNIPLNSASWTEHN